MSTTHKTKRNRASREANYNHKKTFRSPKDPIRNETIFNALQKELEGSYNILITVTTALFGGTLALDKYLALNRLATQEALEHRVWIILAWICLLLAAYLAAWGRLCSGRSLEFLLRPADNQKLDVTQLRLPSLIKKLLGYLLRKCDDTVGAYDIHADHAQVWSLVCFGLGLVFLVVFYSQV